jgi:hypothetical protein
MNKLRSIFAILSILISGHLSASDVRIDYIEWFRSNHSRTTKAVVHLTWQNSWNNNKNHDAVWLFFKFKNQQGNTYRHARLLPAGHRLAYKSKTAPDAAIEVADDGTGAFVYPRSTYRGTVQWKLEFALDSTIFTDRSFNAGAIP